MGTFAALPVPHPCASFVQKHGARLCEPAADAISADMPCRTCLRVGQEVLICGSPFAHLNAAALKQSVRLGYVSSVLVAKNSTRTSVAGARTSQGAVTDVGRDTDVLLLDFKSLPGVCTRQSASTVRHPAMLVATSLHLPLMLNPLDCI